MTARESKNIIAALDNVCAGIARSATLSGRKEGDVTLVAVSKTRDAQDIEPLIAAGVRDFGENRVQEMLDKWPDILARHPGLNLHFIGQLQSNKAADTVRHCASIHSIDRRSLVDAVAKAIAGAADGLDAPPQLFVQVNIGDEDQKGGCAIADLADLLAYSQDKGLDIAGLMAVPPLDVEPAPYFALLAKLADRHGMSALSMGMSTDYETAIMLGATHVRVGSALFGPRS